jgi:Fe-S cluster assembly protein SufD
MALNTAFLEDGAFVLIPRGTIVEEPVHLLFLTGEDGSDEPAVAHPRNLIVAESGGQGTIVESYEGEGTYFTNAVTEIVCADGAVVSHYKVQRESLSGSTSRRSR